MLAPLAVRMKLAANVLTKSHSHEILTPVRADLLLGQEHCGGCDTHTPGVFVGPTLLPLTDDNITNKPMIKTQSQVSSD